MIGILLMKEAERTAAKLRESGCPSAKAVERDGAILVEIDREEAMDAEYQGESRITRALMEIGGRA